MRVVALEEHFTVPALAKRIDPAVVKARGFVTRKTAPGRPNPMELAPEIGDIRLKSMDETGITLQVLSPTGAGPDLVPGADGIAMAREINDHLAEAVARHPKRFAGFATLPMLSPEACADELRRCVKELGFLGALINGTTDGRFLDHPSYDGLLAAAVELDVPVYIHPHRRRGRARRAGLHPSAHSAGGGARSLLFRLRAGRWPRAGDRRLGLALGDRRPRAAHGARRHTRQASEAEDHHRPYG
jgi:predicted TIM-barrel fold metal-dependent hydrolase